MKTEKAMARLLLAYVPRRSAGRAKENSHISRSGPVSSTVIRAIPNAFRLLGLGAALVFVSWTSPPPGAAKEPVTITVLVARDTVEATFATVKLNVGPTIRWQVPPHIIKAVAWDAATIQITVLPDAQRNPFGLDQPFTIGPV